MTEPISEKVYDDLRDMLMVTEIYSVATSGGGHIWIRPNPEEADRIIAVVVQWLA